MNDKDMQKDFERAVTPNVCIELLEDIDTMQARIDELESLIKEADDSLNITKSMSISSGSILHMAFKEALRK